MWGSTKSKVLLRRCREEMSRVSLERCTVAIPTCTPPPVT
jgi:hypothetical protein